MRGFRLVAALPAARVLLFLPVAEQVKPRSLFTKVRVFDGVSERRIENAGVLVDGAPLTDISLLADTEQDLDFITIDGNICNDIL